MNIRALTTSALFAILPALLFAQATVETPKIVVGDQWVFRQTTSPGDTSREWTREVVEVTADGVLRVKIEAGNIVNYDNALNFVSQTRTDQVRLLVKYPLRVGSEWKYTRGFDNRQNEEVGSAKIVARETMQVPAGTFDCYRIEAESAVAAGTQSKWTRWYCPEVKWIAKEIHEERLRRGAATILTSELVKFMPAK